MQAALTGADDSARAACGLGMANRREAGKGSNKMSGDILIKVQSPFADCEGGAESAACQEVIKNLQNPFYIGDQAGATQTTGWVDGWISAPSTYAVAARNADDVVAAVNLHAKTICDLSSKAVATAIRAPPARRTLCLSGRGR